MLNPCCVFLDLSRFALPLGLFVFYRSCVWPFLLLSFPEICTKFLAHGSWLCFSVPCHPWDRIGEIPSTVGVNIKLLHRSTSDSERPTAELSNSSSWSFESETKIQKKQCRDVGYEVSSAFFNLYVTAEVRSYHNIITSSLMVARLDIFHPNTCLRLEYECH